MSTPADQLELETAVCTGVIERVTYYDPAGGWAVLAVVLDDDRRTKVVGHAALRPAQGLRISATGRWQRHERFGLQFSADHLHVLAPASSDGLRSFLIDALPGVGPKTADRIVQAFGEQTPAALEDARRLVTFAGISAARAQKISAAWRARHADRDALVFLRGLGLGERMAARVRAQFEGEPDFARLLSENPYRSGRCRWHRLCTADRAAQTVGIAADAPFRIRAGIVHALELRAQEGHTLTARAVLIDKAKTLLGVDAALIESELEAVVRDGRVTRGAAGDDAVYSCRYTIVLREPDQTRTAFSQAEPQRACQATRIPSSVRHQADPEQTAAVRLALGHRLSILTGGPGTGKALDIETRILTPSGYRRIGDVTVGDLVMKRDGTPTRVAGVYPQGIKKAFRLTFSDGFSVVCCDEHLWTYTSGHRSREPMEMGSRGKKRTASLSLIRAAMKQSKRLALPPIEALAFPPAISR